MMTNSDCLYLKIDKNLARY